MYHKLWSRVRGDRIECSCQWWANRTQQKDQVEDLELNVLRPDHVHLAVSISPKYAVSSFVGYLKGKLAIQMFERYEKLGRHLWARRYCVSTIGLDEEKIRKYVAWQEQHEKQLEAIQGKLFD
jgi:putative transposase